MKEVCIRNSKHRRVLLVGGIFFLGVRLAIADGTGPGPTPFTTPPPIPSPSPITTPTPPPAGQATSTADQTLPVVVTYGDGLETRGQIVGGVMQPIGVPPDKSVTVTIFLASSVPGTPLRLGLYDGGVVAAASLPGQNMIDPLTDTVQQPDNGPATSVNAQSTVQFNFQAGRVLGLYRVLLTVSPRQYLLQFYAVRPRSTSVAPAIPTATPNSAPPP